MAVSVRPTAYSALYLENAAVLVLQPGGSPTQSLTSAIRALRWGMAANEHLARKAQADLIIDRTAQQFRLLLEETAREVRPFPPFPGAFFTNAVEVALDGVERADLGCIVVAEDGALYELEMKIDFGEEFGDVIDPVQAREENLKKLDDLHPRDYVVLAYNALTQLTEILLERADTADDGS